MSAKIITDPKNLERDQVVCPSLCQLEQVALITFRLAVDMSRHVARAEALEDTQHYRRFISACLKSMSYKMLAIKRLGPNYISEVRAIFRVHTEIAVDFFWLADHYKRQKEHAELLSKQFFLFGSKQFLETFPGEEALRQDPFLKPFASKEGWLKSMKGAARKEIKGVLLKGNDWRIASGVTNRKTASWDARCKHAIKHAEQMANLKSAPFHRNLKMLSSYSHWDSTQIQEHDEEDLRTALFARDLNIAIGFVHDVMTGACSLAHLGEPPEEAIATRQRFPYMST